MSSADVSSRRPHVLVIAFPSQGHLLPLLDFAHLLSTRHRVHITVAATPSSLPLLSAFLASTPLAAALPMPLPDPSAPEQAGQLAPGTHHALLAVPLSTLRGPLVSWARAQRHPPTAVLSDFFLGSAQLIADDLRVPRVVFYSSGAFATAVAEPLWSGSLPLDPNSSVVLGDLPGSPSIPYAHVPSMLKAYVPGDPDWELAREGFLLNSRAWGAVLNTFAAMEGDFLEHLKRRFGHGRVWAVGPVSASGCRARERPAAETEELFSWLAACPARSVLYVCFGSMYKPPPAQAAALGAALEASGVRFIWAVSADVAVLPEGLEERARDRGRVVRGWAPQMEILRHAAVGAFVTHCGWNSTLEGVAAGVTLVTWPMKADQFIDARLVVDVHGAAVRAAEGESAVPDPTTLARVFEDAVDGAELAGVRAKAVALAVAAAEAVEEGGSSWLDLERMVRELEAVAAAA
ncbi:flavonol 3-O-glucosyltransferase UGT89B1-like [Lolium rigidum]|uniref:flavonol 3-O-glucosyltransferase UGT89B1-like n=1 Tax=Lolium rigidum TaxID=89674 RepID=UPI001F5E0EE3|nr:flavonol 3-O-glucosyltransferase UGT89B1-like [Lolium rigidum]